MKNDVVNCARCGEDHKDVEFEKLDRPINGVLVRGVSVDATEWAPCPTNGQPILLGRISSR